MSLYDYENIIYDAVFNRFQISTGASRADIQTVLDTAPDGAEIHFGAGTFEFDGSLTVDRDNLKISGNTDEAGPSIFKFADTVTGDAFVIKGKLETASVQTLSEDITVGAKTLQLADTSSLKVGDILHVYQDNDEAFLSSGIYDLVRDSPYMATCPLRESLVEIESIDGNVVTLKHAIAYDMTGGIAKVEIVQALKNIEISNLTMSYDLGPLDANTFDNAQVGFENHTTMSVSYTDNIKISNITLVHTPSLGLDMRNSLDANVSYLTVDGAYNKGGEGNGYGLHISGTSHSNFEHLTITDVRHAVIFSSWNAEAWNTVQVDFTNRDINYHGSPDHSNTVTVNESVYSEGDQVWALVSPGAVDVHPYTDISQNTNLFGHAVGGSKIDTVFGWDNGAVLSGKGGDDNLTGGGGSDLISGDEGNDYLAGLGGSDVFVFHAGDDSDTIADFQSGGVGDILMVDNFAALASMADLKLEQVGSDTKITLMSAGQISDTVLLKNVDAATLTADNFSFTPQSVPVALNLSTSSAEDWIKAGANTDDVVTSRYSNLSSTDVISLGSGLDTLRLDTVSFSMDTALLSGVSGVDHLDVTLATSAKITLSQGFLNQTDSGTLSIVYGANGVERLTANGLDASARVLLSGNGLVRLADNIDNTVTITTETLGSVIGQRGHDSFKVEGLGAVTLDGGFGNDTVYVASETLNTAATLKGGDGVDTLVISGAAKMSPLNLPQISGFEKIVFTSSGAELQVNDAMVVGGLDISGSGTTVLSEKIRISSLTQSATFFAGSNLALSLTGTSALTHTVKVKDGVNGSIKGSAGSDILLGGSGNDCLRGMDGTDDINGGQGKDSLYGGNGADTFRFVRGEAMDTVNDFAGGAGGDVIALTSYYQFTTFADVLTALAQRDATTVKLTLSPTEYIMFKNQTLANFTADNFTFDNSKVLNLTLQATSGVDKLVAVGGTDVVEVNGAKLGSGDIVDLGAGKDVLRLIGSVGTVDGNVATIKGIEVIDATLATVAPRLVVTDQMVSSNGTGTLSIVVGSAGVTGLDTSAVSDLSSVVLQGNNTNIAMANGVANKIILDPAINMVVNGGTGAESFRVRGGDVTINSGDGNDSVTVIAAASLHLDGGNGDDVFMMSNSGFVDAQTVKGGAGFDELRFYQADNFTFADLANVSGMERLTLGNGVSTLDLDTTLFQSALTLKAGSGTSEVYIDVTRLDIAHKLIIDSGILAHLNGEAGDTYTIESTSKANQVIIGSVGNETFTGGTAADTVYAGDGNDTLSGGYGKDHLFGDNGDDVVYGGRDADILTGGSGNDVFVFHDRAEGGDTITDFSSVLNNQDSLDMTALFDANGLGAETFASALSKSILILQQSGADVLVSFDRDGVKSSVADLMATLQNVDVFSLNETNVIL